MHFSNWPAGVTTGFEGLPHMLKLVGTLSAADDNQNGVRIDSWKFYPTYEWTVLKDINGCAHLCNQYFQLLIFTSSQDEINAIELYRLLVTLMLEKVLKL